MFVRPPRRHSRTLSLWARSHRHQRSQLARVRGSRARGLDGSSDLADTNVRANLTDHVRAIPDPDDGAEQR